MSESDAAVDRGDTVEDDCPLCLESLPPFWDVKRRSAMVCCGNEICVDCSDKKFEYLTRAVAEGTFGRQDEQLGNHCPSCRTELPDGDEGKILLGKFDEGQLPLKMYGMLGKKVIDGQGGVEMNLQRGIEILMLGAEKGDPECQFTIGKKYRNGEGLPKSPKEAKKWLLAATEQGHAIAEHDLAVIMRDEGNDAEAVWYMRGSAAKGFDGACYNLGVLYYNGENGLQRSPEEAIRAVTPAAERGHARSMSMLGCILCSPDPQLPPDNPNFTKGMHWVRQAAATGDPVAISTLKRQEEASKHICFRCNKGAPPETTYLRCSRCRAAWYCSRDCQRRHWKAKEGGHKQFCIKWE